jgi:hypothetical protein
MGPASFANQGGAFGDATFVIGAGSPDQVFRPNSTFAWPSHFALFLAMTTLLCLGAVLASHGAIRLLLACALAFLLLVNVIEAQRLIYIALPPVMAIVLLTRRRLPGARVLFAASLVVSAVIVGLILLQSVGLNPLLRPRELLADPGAIVGDRWTGYVTYVREALTASPLGLGTGATAIGSRHVLNSVPLFVENPVAKVIGELSIVGLLAYVWLFFRLIVTTARSLRTEAAAGHGSVADFIAATLGCQVLIFFTGYDIAVAAMLLWFLSGAVSRPWVNKSH